jgi:hypothetical protein
LIQRPRRTGREKVSRDEEIEKGREKGKFSPPPNKNERGGELFA